jgi:RNA polymerase sigma-70 factor (ECF subfamily)
VAQEERERLFGVFSEAVRSLDVEALAKVLAEDAVMLSDGGGKVTALPRPLRGGTLIAKALIGFAKLWSRHAWRVEPARINGLPGCLFFDDATGQLVQTIAMAPAATEPGRIGALYIQRNPDKLKGVRAARGDVTGREAGSS